MTGRERTRNERKGEGKRERKREGVGVLLFRLTSALYEGNGGDVACGLRVAGRGEVGRGKVCGYGCGEVIAVVGSSKGGQDVDRGGGDLVK